MRRGAVAGCPRSLPPGRARPAAATLVGGAHTSRDVTLFTSDLRSGNMRRTTQEPRGVPRTAWLERAIDRGEQWRRSGDRVGSRGVARRIAPATPPLSKDERLDGSGDTAHGRRTTDAAPPPPGVDAASVPCWLAAVSCAGPAKLCARPRSDLPRYREAHGCAVRSRDRARAPHTWRRWSWLALHDAASRSCARSATVERRRRPADRGMQPEPASLPRRAVHSQTHPPSRADHTAGPYLIQGKVCRVSGGQITTMSQVSAVVNGG